MQLEGRQYRSFAPAQRLIDASISVRKKTMKIKGKKLDGPNIEVVVIPRQSGDLVFKAQAVLNYEDCDKLNPMPTAPKMLLRGGGVQENVEDPRYKAKIEEWATRKFYWMLIKSLEATEGLEWETVKMDDPSTWSNYKTEMQTAGLSPGEIGRIEICVTDACGLNQSKIDEATKRFLAGQAQVPSTESFQNSEQQSTPSGVPANVGA